MYSIFRRGENVGGVSPKFGGRRDFARRTYTIYIFRENYNLNNYLIV